MIGTENGGRSVALSSLQAFPFRARANLRQIWNDGFPVATDVDPRPSAG